jgi:hypothetical protein
LAASAEAQVTTFDGGTEGWSVSGRDDISQFGGNPGANMDVFLDDVFGAEIRNSTAPFTGDFRNRGNLTFTVDIQIDSIQFFFSEVERNLVVQLYNYDVDGRGTAASVWAPIGTLGIFNTEWTTYSATLDTTSVGLPGGWFGAGDEDPNTFEPILPPGVTVQDVLAGVDEIAFTTFVPGFFFGFTNFDMSVDNVGIVPAPGAIAVMIGSLGLLGRRRR